MSQTEHTCGCCEGTEKLTPLPLANRPGLNELRYRAGTHASFLETMLARLSSHAMEIPLDEADENGGPKTLTLHPLQALRSRAPEDPAMAMLDAWAAVAEVLTYYQERIANEGYLRTATERRSILELARLVGYSLRPGLAASVYLAFTVEDVGHEVEIPAGTRAQSLPGPGELPQSFETSERLMARPEWNSFRPRFTKLQNFTLDKMPSGSFTVSFEDANLNLNKNDLLLFEFSGEKKIIYTITDLKPNPVLDQTEVTLSFWGPDTAAASKMRSGSISLPPLEAIQETVKRAISEAPTPGVTAERVVKRLRKLEADLASGLSADEKAAVFVETLDALEAELKQATGSKLKTWLDKIITKLWGLAEREAGTDDGVPEVSNNIEQEVLFFNTIAAMKTLPAEHPASAQQLALTAKEAFAANTDTGLQAIVAMDSRLGKIYPVLASNSVDPAPPADKSPLLHISVFRVKTGPFGHNAPLKFNSELNAFEEWKFDDNRDDTTKKDLASKMLTLDALYEQVVKFSWVAIEISDHKTRKILRVDGIQPISRADYGIPATNVTQLTLDANWLESVAGENLSLLRGTTVYVQPEVLALAQDLPTVQNTERTTIGFDKINPETSKRIELDALYPGLQSGRWLIVEGERTDLPGIVDRELVMLAGIEQSSSQEPGDNATRTTLTLSDGLAFSYKADTVKIYANVVKSTHGETRAEVLGSGDGSKALQTFDLRQSPLTFLAAPTAVGAESTLQVRVNDVLWKESDNLAELSPTDRHFTTRTDDEGKTTVVFGNGKAGSRLPTGVENVAAVYRNGIGKPGNVKAEQISLLAAKPLGVKSVVNPLAASGGAEKESRDQARRTAPLAVMALDRLVSTQDYADFARAFAGIGKASAARLTDGQCQIVHVTIAGSDDIRIDRNSDLYRNLFQALRQLGDPYQPIQLDVRELILLVISARVRLQPEYLWDKVKPQIRQTLLEAFGFERRELGQDALASEAISIIQAVPGVAYVDLDTFDAVNEYLILKNLVDAKGIADSLRLKQRIVVNMAGPVYHTVEVDGYESLLSIALRYSTSTQELQQLNPQVKFSVPKGTRLLVRRIGSAQLAVLSPDVKDTLLLNEITS